MDAQNNLEWLLLGMALSDMECLRRVNPQWWTNFKLRAIVEEVQSRMTDTTQELPALTETLRELGALAWNFEGTIRSVADAKERIEERVDVNSQYEQAWQIMAGLFGVDDYGMHLRERHELKSTEQKLDVIARVLGRESK